jgi:hypothetical protein
MKYFKVFSEYGKPLGLLVPGRASVFNCDDEF